MFLITKYLQMKYTVITTFHQAGMELYGQKMIDTFERYWPDSVDLVVYAENCQPRVTKPNVRVIDLLPESKSCRRFVKRHRNNPEAHGGQGPHNVGEWSEKKSFKWQAVRFCYKVFSVQHAAENINTDWLIWLDADSQTHSTVPVKFLDRVCPTDALASYLGRTDRYHSECGWVAYNMRHPQGRDFVKYFANMYETDEIFNYPEWHDSFIWDIARRHFRDQGARFRDLNPEPDTKGMAGHPFINSELGAYMDHMKGDRKNRGHSKAKEVRLHATHPYWRKVLGA
jgi:hypothetical protein